ncbi:acyclic terpene utilization AtuA family protein [Fodinicola acaciae]|uniref:acyclic terpene utilization AtuA family protein n=1 Tax=Fodinicola acaciae TaxID=2681555 RepID=UPI0013D1191B|nr:acyclic terpene utilization AtuA family protein [Fodinicola acaciae]
MDGPVRIGNFSGYLGDRFTAIDEVMAGDPVDVLMGDYLAEVTLAALSGRESRGYVGYFVNQIRPHLAAIADRGMKVVTNAGGFAPAALAEALSGHGLRVAYVEGDNVLDRLGAYADAGHRLENLDTGEPLAAWGRQPVAANAYLGGWGIARALREGADIVVCGRVTDASLTAGPAAWWHGWSEDDWDALAGAVVAGHVVECGAHATGGNFSGFTRIPHLLAPGFPIAEIAADGTSVITKHSRDDGAVTVDTVTAQLLYEIQGPRYLNPDVTVDLQSVEPRQLSPGRVEIRGATGSPPPPTTKVAVFAPVGYEIVNTVFVTAPDVDQKIDLLKAQIGNDLPDGVEVHFTRIGSAADNPRTQWDATVALRVMATAAERDPLMRLQLARRLTSLYLQSIPGFYHDGGSQLTGTPKPRIDFWPALLPMSAVDHRVVVEGRTYDIPARAKTEITSQPTHPEPMEPPPATDVREVPLGTIAYARSGDKGGNSNVGIWVSDDRAWPWLRQALSTVELRRLVPELAGLEVVRHEFPRLRAVHFVLKGLLGTGGSANLRVDRVGKAVGEYIRAKHLPVPVELLEHSAN